MEHGHGNLAYNSFRSNNNSRQSFGANGRGNNNHNRPVPSHVPNNLPAHHYNAGHGTPPVGPNWNANMQGIPQPPMTHVLPPYPTASWQPSHPHAQYHQLTTQSGAAAAAPTAFYPSHLAFSPYAGQYQAAAPAAAPHVMYSGPQPLLAGVGGPTVSAAAYQPQPTPLIQLQTQPPPYQHRHSGPSHQHQHHHQQQQQQQQLMQHQQMQMQQQSHLPRKPIPIIDPKTNTQVELTTKQQQPVIGFAPPQPTQQQPQQMAVYQQQPTVAAAALTDIITSSSADEQQQRHVQRDLLAQVHSVKVAPKTVLPAPVPPICETNDPSGEMTLPKVVETDNEIALEPETASNSTKVNNDTSEAAVLPSSSPVPDEELLVVKQQSEKPVESPQLESLRLPPSALRCQSVDSAVSGVLHHSQSHGQLLELSGSVAGSASSSGGPTSAGVQSVAFQSALVTSSASKTAKCEYEFKPEKFESDKMMLERKQTYDRMFLLSLQDTYLSTQKPLTLPGDLPELLRSKADVQRFHGGNFIPEYVKGQGQGSKDKSKPAFLRQQQQQQQQQQQLQPQGRGSVPGGTPKHQQQPQLQKQTVIEVRNREKIDLHHAEKAYVPGFMKRPDEGESSRLQESERTIRSVLNKVTPQNFESCFTQLTTSCDIGTAAGLKICVDIIFEKAIRETSYSFVFAEICKRLAFLKVEVDRDNSEPSSQKTLTYRGLLLRKCQDMFETPLLDLMQRKSAEWDAIISDEQKDEKKKSLEEEKEEQVKKVKDQYYGNIRFIGELFMKEILTPAIIHSCIKALLTSGESTSANISTQTESLECLCELLRTVGKRIESIQAKCLDECFNKVTKLIDHRNVESKVRFKLIDLIEMRQRSWELREMERRLQERPMTKEELELRERQMEEERRVLAASGPGSSGRGRNAQGGGYGRPPASPSAGDPPPVASGTGWTSVATRRPQKMDARKLILDAPPRSDAGGAASATPRLGPSRPNFSKARAAATGAGKEGDVGRSPTVQRLGGRQNRDSPVSSRDASPRPQQQQPDTSAAAAPVAPITTVPSVPLMHRSISTHELPSRAAESGKPNLVKSILAKDALMRKSKNIMEEWLAGVISLEDTKACFREIASHPHLKVFVEVNAEHLLNINSKELREKGGRLLFELLDCQLIAFQTVIDGFSPIMETADDVLADFPMLGAYLGEIFSAFMQKTASYLDCVLQLVEIIAPEIQSYSGSKRRPLRGEVLSRMAHLASIRLGHERVGEAFREAGVDWPFVLAVTPTEAADFVAAQELQFTEAPLPALNHPLSLERLAGRVQEAVRRGLPGGDVDRLAESIIDLLERGVPASERECEAFNQELVRGVCGACLCAGRLDATLLKRLSPVLSRFIEGFPQEIWSLKAAACLAVGQSDGVSELLSELFTVFLDNQLVSEEAFKQWFEDEEITNKGQREAVRSFMGTLASTSVRDSSGA